MKIMRSKNIKKVETANFKIKQIELSIFTTIREMLACIE
jgi:hypothetical protein